MTDFRDGYKTLAMNYAETFALLVVVGVTAYLLPINLSGNKWASLIAVFLPSWATLCTVIWGIQTFEGKTPPENLNKWVLRSSYMIGFVLFILVWK